jgi:hypothetical protein
MRQLPAPYILGYQARMGNFVLLEIQDVLYHPRPYVRSGGFRVVDHSMGR